MARRSCVTHEFVDEIPEELDEGVLYVSVSYETAAHRCLCGCGSLIVTPFSPTDWRLIFDGDSVSLWPSIGNWSFACQSHYWVWESQVVWAKTMSKNRIERGRDLDRKAKLRHHSEKEGATSRGHRGTRVG